MNYAERARQNAHRNQRRPLWNEHEAAGYLGVSVMVLRHGRMGRGEFKALPYVKLYGRIVRYEPEVIEEVVTASRRGLEPEAAAA
jgi:hypothetical protein